MVGTVFVGVLVTGWVLSVGEAGPRRRRRAAGLLTAYPSTGRSTRSGTTAAAGPGPRSSGALSPARIPARAADAAGTTNAVSAPHASTAAPARAEPAVTPRVRPVTTQVSASVRADRDTRDSTSDIPDTSTGAIASPATKTTATRLTRE